MGPPHRYGSTGYCQCGRSREYRRFIIANPPRPLPICSRCRKRIWIGDGFPGDAGPGIPSQIQEPPISAIRGQAISALIIPGTQALAISPTLLQPPHWYRADGPLYLETSSAPVAATNNESQQLCSSRKVPTHSDRDFPIRRLSRNWTTRIGAYGHRLWLTCFGGNIAPIHMLPFDILLEVFELYRQADIHSWSLSYGWITLAHVCRRWRQCVLAFASSLRLIICCKTGSARLTASLGHLPPLPVSLEYISSARTEDPQALCPSEDNAASVLSARGTSSRLCSITLTGPEATLSRLAGQMGGPTPSLCSLGLRLQPSPNAVGGIILPGTFLDRGAPNLRHILLDNVFLSSLARLLSSTQQLTSLSLRIPSIVSISPDELLASLANLTHLTYLSIQVLRATPFPASQNMASLPRLERLVFCGPSYYLEDLVAGIDIPSVESLNIKLFHQLTFTIPHLSDLIAGAVKLNQGSVARIDFTSFSGELHVYPRIEDAQAISSMGVHIVIPNGQLDWQTHSMAQLCHALAPGLTEVQSLFVGYHLKELPKQWREEVQPSLWVMLLLGFRGVRTLWVSKALVWELGRALDPGDGGSVDDLPMPALDAIVAPSDEPSPSQVRPIVREAFESFCAARRNVRLTYVKA